MSRIYRLIPLTLLLAASPASAHFSLTTPSSWATQDLLGSPQKSAPCGDADPGSPATPTGNVTTYQAGSTITITINEIIFHPGHYRVLLAKDHASLPADPLVTAGQTACGSTVITTNPTLPLLADGLLLHTAAFSGPQTMQVQLPSGMTCTGCTLQVVEFMSNHPLNNPGGCFYHHCATVNITAGPAPDAGPIADAGPTADATLPPTDATTVGHDGGTLPTGGCGCQTGAPDASTLASLLLTATLLLKRRRR
jgi:MYXO-CTERM domain-containing protein